MLEISLLVTCILFPLISGLILLVSKNITKVKREILVLSTLVISTIAANYFAYIAKDITFTIAKFTDQITFAFRADGMSQIFVMMVTILWVITAVYAIGYMNHVGKENRFFAFFLLSFSVVLGLAYSANFLTLYAFYEFITLATLPLVMHELNGKSRYAGKIYIEYMMLGASFAFIGLIFVLNFELQPTFTYGGILDPSLVEGNTNILLFVFLVAALGFGVKAAIWPFHGWLPKASVAPTPVTALLHAVAVVKAGIFAMIRLIYYTFGTELLSGTWAQAVLIILACITIIYGSVTALRTNHFKRRFAYSTIANLSYIILAISLMNFEGLIAGVSHMLFHAVLKITLFFVTGNVLYKTHKEYIDELDGLGINMKLSFFSFVVAGLGLAGVPPLLGYFSKHNILEAILLTNHSLSIISFLAILISAFFTGIYVIQIVLKVYKFDNLNIRKQVENKEVSKHMKYALSFLVLSIFVLSFFVSDLMNIVSSLLEVSL